MIEEFQLKAAKYIMEWGNWIEKLELLTILNIPKDKIITYVNRLLSLQNVDGGFPKDWIKGNPSGVIETAKTLDIISKNYLENDNRIKKAIDFLLEKQLEDGSWIEENPDYGNNTNDIITSSQVIKALIAMKIQGDKIDKGIKYLIKYQRDDGLWPKTRTDPSPDLEATSKVIVALNTTKNKLASKAVKEGFNGLMETFMEKTTKDWDMLSEDILTVIEAILQVQQKNNEAVRKIITNYVRSENWNFKDRRSRNPSTLLNILKIMSLAGNINGVKLKEEVERLLELREKFREVVVKIDDEAKEIMLSRFETLGIRRNDSKEKILLGLFIYATLEQFFWAAQYDPHIEFIGIIDNVGTLNNIDNYMITENVRRALFKSKALSGVAKRKKEDVARSIALFARFLGKSGELNSFEEFTKSLMEFTLFELAPTLSGTTTAKKLGLLLRNYTSCRNEPYKLFESLKLSLECFPSIGVKISTLYPYYVIWIYNIWSEVKKYVEAPIDWNTVKTYVNLGLSNLTLKDLRKDPRRASLAIERLAEELFPEDKAKISTLWIAGKEWCTKPYGCYGYMGKKCWFYNICNRRIKYEERRKDDMGQVSNKILSQN